MIKVGQKLRDERIKKNLSLEDVSRATKIRVSFLSAIEKGEYKSLPSSAYIYGFIKNYAEHLGLSSKSILALLRREFDSEKELKVLPEGFAGRDFPIHGLRLRQIPILIILIFIVFLGYIAFQYRDLFLATSVDIYAPKENSSVKSQDTVVSGKTDPSVTLFINNSSVPIETDGSFKKNLDLFPGKTTIIIKVVNRFGRQTVVERHVEVK